MFHLIRNGIIITFWNNNKHNLGKIMKLKEYLTENKFTHISFINAVEQKTGHSFSQGGLAKYVIGARIPRKREMQVLYDFTDGKVAPNDFYL